MGKLVELKGCWWRYGDAGRVEGNYSLPNLIAVLPHAIQTRIRATMVHPRNEPESRPRSADNQSADKQTNEYMD